MGGERGEAQRARNMREGGKKRKKERTNTAELQSDTLADYGAPALNQSHTCFEIQT